MANSKFDTNQTEVIEEGIKDFIKDATGIDASGIKKTWTGGRTKDDKTKKFDDKYTSAIKKTNSTVNQTAGALIGKGNDIIRDNDAKGNRVDNRSIFARARNSVLQFPVYASQTMRYNDAHTVGKLFERVYATLVQTVLQNNPILDENEANDLVFLKKIHTNIQEAGDALSAFNKYYEPIDDLDRMMCESVFLEQDLTPNCKVVFRAIKNNDPMLIAENARLINEPCSGLAYIQELGGYKKDDKVQSSTRTTSTEEETPDQITTTNKTSSTSNTIRFLDKDEIEEIAAKRAGISDADVKLSKMTPQDIEAEVRNKRGDHSRGRTIDPDTERAIQKLSGEVAAAKKALSDAVDEMDKAVQPGGALPKLKGKNGKHEPGEYYKDEHGKWYRIDSKINVNDPVTSVRKGGVRTTTTSVETDGEILKAPTASKLLKDYDIKKLNGMLPYSIEVSFYIRGDQGLKREVRYIVNVKTVMHLISINDLAEDLQEIVTGKIKSLQKVRYKTGEITFKDYFLNLKGLKSDAAKRMNSSKKWINTLKRLGEWKSTYGSLLNKPIQDITGGDVPIPNGTLLLTSTDVTTLTNQTGIDLSKVNNAKILANNLFLIAVVIVDPLEETMRVLFTDSDNDWDVQSLSSINAELAKSDSGALGKEIQRMINR